MTNFFDRVDFTPDDVDRDVARLKAERTEAAPDRRICACGHGARSHSSHSLSENAKYLRSRGMFKCSPGKVKCACLEFRPVAVTSDVRRFTSKTEGPGSLHALSKGAKLAQDKGHTVEWIEGVGCDKCHRTDVAITPIAYTENYVESTMTTPRNRLVCATCREETALEVQALAPGPVTA